jgi:arylsulfatase A-like enzyme
VLTSDHGESLGEGGRWGHGSALDGAQLRVPLAVRARAGTAWTPPEPLALASVLPAVVGAAPLAGGAAGVPVAGLRGVEHRAHRWDGATAHPEGPPLVGGAPIEWSTETADALRVLGYTAP